MTKQELTRLIHKTFNPIMERVYNEWDSEEDERLHEYYRQKKKFIAGSNKPTSYEFNRREECTLLLKELSAALVDHLLKNYKLEQK